MRVAIVFLVFCSYLHASDIVVRHSSTFLSEEEQALNGHAYWSPDIEISGYYKACGLTYPKAVMVEHYNPLGVQTVAAVRIPLTEERRARFTEKCAGITDGIDFFDLVVSRINSRDPVELRPHHSFLAISPDDAALIENRLNLAINVHAVIKDLVESSVGLADDHTSLSAHPGPGYVILSPDALKLSGFDIDKSHLFLSRVTADDGSKKVLTLHWMPCHVLMDALVDASVPGIDHMGGLLEKWSVHEGIVVDPLFLEMQRLILG